ncbi:unnamed protein product [Caenorhabditis brenneri]
MSLKPMSYECIECLLRHMDANTRFQISRRCPSLRALEKVTPLKVNKLHFTSDSVVVNQFKYRLSIYQKYNNGRTPGFVRRNNEIGFIHYEVDRFGIEDESDRRIVSPGDVEMKWPPREENIDQDEMVAGIRDEEKIQELQNEIRALEARMVEQQGRRPTRRRRSNNREIKDILERERAKLLAHQCRFNNVTPPYEYFLQLSIKNLVAEDGDQVIERYVHNKKFSEAMRYLSTLFFSGRRYPVYVKFLEFTRREGVVRFPLGIQFKIQSLKFPAAASLTLDGLTSIIHESSYPLKSLDVFIFSLADAQHMIVQAARALTIKVYSQNEVQILLNLPNPMIKLVTKQFTFAAGTLGQLLMNWITTHQAIGKEVSMEFSMQPWLADEMEEVRARYHGQIIDDKNMIIPMNATAQIRVTYGEYFSPAALWGLRLRVESILSAQYLNYWN